MKSRGPCGYELCRLTCQASIVRLNGDLDHLSVLGGYGVTLAAIVARDGSGVKCDVPCLCELSGRVGDEADTTRLVLIQGLAPCIGAEAMFSSDLRIGGGAALHPGVIDCDDKDLASGLQLVTGNVSWNMVARASRRESSGNANDETLARGELFGQVDPVAWRCFEKLDVRNGVTFFDLCSINISSMTEGGLE